MGCGLPVGDSSWTRTRAPRILAPVMSMDARLYEEQAEAARIAAERVPSSVREVNVDEVEAARFALPRGAAPSKTVWPEGWGSPRQGGGHLLEAGGLQSVVPGAGHSVGVGLVGPEVDIYLSAGPASGYGASGPAGYTTWDPSAYSGCNRDDPRSCSIWRVRVRPGHSTATAVERVVSASTSFGGRAGSIQEIRTGASMPALSPDGRYLAYRRRNYSDIDTFYPQAGDAESAVVVRDLRHGTERVVDSSSHRSDALRFPEFFDDGRLLYSRGTEQKGGAVGGTTYAVDVDWRTGTAGSPMALLGAESGTLPETAFDNPRVRPATGLASASSLHRKLVSFGRNDKPRRACGPAPQAMPRVHDAAGAPSSFECFDPQMPGGPDIRSCQHPQWSLDGRAIYCWLNDPTTRLGQPGEDIYLQTTHRYELSGSGGAYDWALSTDQRAFREFNASELAALFPLFPAGTIKKGSSPDCKFTIYKHTGECGSSNFLILTLFCADKWYNQYNEHSDLFVSRVMLIRKDPIAYWDVTGMIEEREGYNPGSLQGVYSTCRVVEGGWF